MRALLCLLPLTACAIDPELSSTESDVTSYPAADVVVPADYPREHPLIVGPATYLTAGQSLLLDARGVTTSSDSETRMQELTIHCWHLFDTSSELKIYSTQNRDGTDEREQYVRAMYVAPIAGNYRCDLVGAAKDFDGPNTAAYHTYQMDKTYLSQTVPVAPGDAWRWGTDNDLTYPLPADEVSLVPAHTMFVGPGLAYGTSEYVLHSTLITPPTNVSKLDFRFEIEMTTCKDGNNNCTPSTRGGFFDQWYGSGADVQIVVEQLYATGSAVCATTTSPVQHFYITSEEVHAKAHAIFDNIAISPACSRRFVAKAKVTWTDRNPIEINYGYQGASGYSTGFAWGHN